MRGPGFSAVVGHVARTRSGGELRHTTRQLVWQRAEDPCRIHRTGEESNCTDHAARRAAAERCTDRPLLQEAMSLLRVSETLVNARDGQTSEEERMGGSSSWADRSGPEHRRRLDIPPRGGEVRPGDA
jgi:sulfite reductase beta subunit-like hemoprotein